MRAILSAITIIIFLSGSFNSARAADGNGAVVAAGFGVAVLSGIGFLYSSLIIGPSAGHWYAQQHSRGWKSLALRAGLAALGIAFFYLAYAATGSSSS